MDNLEEQLQQLRLIHNRITSDVGSLDTKNGKIDTAATTTTMQEINASAVAKGNLEEFISESREFETTINNLRKKQHPALENPYNCAQKEPQMRWEIMKKHQLHIKRRDNTLDNPIVLDQQLEALAHHKRQMERQGLLQSRKHEELNSTQTPVHLMLLEDSRGNSEMLETNTSPPSPVSSSYSELRHAIDVQDKEQQKQQKKQHIVPEYAANYINFHYGHVNNDSSTSAPLQDANDYYDFGSFSQAPSSTYESIYEPINPRPTSQMSNISRNRLEHNNTLSFNMPYANLLHTVGTTPAIAAPPSTNDLMSPHNSDGLNTTVISGNENIYSTRDCSYETESLTEYLDRSMDISVCENYGNCCKCSEPVLGENSGCTAMNHIYHIECFTCTQCQINLQGKPFYAIENKAYCEYDYLQTLEKCSVCTKPILERILRATGKPYHPQCFTCVVCDKSLDGIPFTVDATNQNYCITDFHKKFAPRCCVCKDPIMPESGEEETVRVVALDRSFHLKCYQCEVINIYYHMKFIEYHCRDSRIIIVIGNYLSF